MANSNEKILFAEERKQSIVKIVNQKKSIKVHDLCAFFSVSPTTIRCDLNELEEAGLLKRTYGGAMCNLKTTFEHTPQQKEVEMIREKIAIAHAAAKYVKSGDSIALDTGTTAFELAKLLVNIESITVLTNDLRIASFLEENSNAHIIVAGGSLRKNFHCTYGSFAENMMDSLNIDKAFIETNAICYSRGDLSTPNFEMSRVKSAICKVADEIILLADNSKFHKRALVKFAEISQVDLIITDSKTDPQLLAQIQENGTGVEIADYIDDAE